jgi:hypothetical protein
MFQGNKQVCSCNNSRNSKSHLNLFLVYTEEQRLFEGKCAECKESLQFPGNTDVVECTKCKAMFCQGR